ncbi:MAG TPA: hypothetical protein PKV16_05230 [Caldisericia bacterium]|nr:hypothetical protein [Caldisericia bacterium]HPF48716.1 hypothetical protein [Caldisericia bacterium]HPI83624.1 hypothetical protein [Caldisericia bacterium]HPQ93171.1 hypothetical protein [Caldisericia bacterium]HRV74996.1 hypothetical protein [Caldisericia bacterium]
MAIATLVSGLISLAILFCAVVIFIAGVASSHIVWGTLPVGVYYLVIASFAVSLVGVFLAFETNRRKQKGINWKVGMIISVCVLFLSFLVIVGATFLLRVIA